MGVPSRSWTDGRERCARFIESWSPARLSPWRPYRCSRPVLGGAAAGGVAAGTEVGEVGTGVGEVGTVAGVEGVGVAGAGAGVAGVEAGTLALVSGLSLASLTMRHHPFTGRTPRRP